MIQLILFLLVAAALFVSLYWLARGSSHAEGSALVMFEARQALSTLQNGLLPTELVARIFAKEDLDYVTANSPQAVQELFFAERRKIAVSWVRQIRSQILYLRHFHKVSARFYERLSPATEIRLGLDFLVLIWMCRVLELAISMRGPYAAPRIVTTTTAVAGRICEISEKSMGILTTTGAAGALREKSTGGEATL